jgi:hypothetical protein
VSGAPQRGIHTSESGVAATESRLKSTCVAACSAALILSSPRGTPSLGASLPLHEVGCRASNVRNAVTTPSHAAFLSVAWAARLPMR